MKILVTGAKGQLGQDLMAELAGRRIEQWAWMWKIWISPTGKPAAGYFPGEA